MQITSELLTWPDKVLVFLSGRFGVRSNLCNASVGRELVSRRSRSGGGTRGAALRVVFDAPVMHA